MAQKSDGGSSSTGPKPEATAKIEPTEARQHLLARVAGSVAAGIVGAPSEKASTAAAVAEIAVEIAEEILKKADL